MKKTSLFKRAIAVFVSVLMVVTSIPFTAITAFADDETIVWKFDPSQTSATGNGSTFNKGSAFKVVDPSNNNSFIQGVFWNETDKNCNDNSSTYVHAEDAAISGGTGSTTGFGDRKLYGNHWIFQYRYAYLAQGKNGSGNDASDNNNTSVFALGNDGANVVNITGDGNVYINGSATPTAQIDRNKMICNDKADVRTAAFEFENGTLTFSIKGETLFTTTAINGTPDITNFFMGASKVTTAGGTMQYVGPANTGNLIHGMYLYKLIGSVITPSESTAIKKSGTLSPAKYQLITGSGSRLSSGNWNIVNDREQGNTSAGIVKYDISALKGTTANSASLQVQITTAPLGDYQGLVFYWTTDSNVESKLGNGETTGGITGSGSYGSGVNANQKVGATLGFNVDNNKLCSLPQSTNTAGTHTITVDKANLQKIIDTGSNVVYIVCMQTQAGGSGSDGGWTDTIVSPTSIKLTYDCEIPDATKEEVAAAYNALPKSPTPKTSNTTQSADGVVKKTDMVGGDAFSNVLYMSKINEYSSGSDDHWGYGTISYGNVTLLYDGTNDMAFPVTMSAKRTSSWANSGYKQSPHSMYLNSEYAELRHIWHGYGSSRTYVTSTQYGVNYVNSHTCSNPSYHSLSSKNEEDYYSNTVYLKNVDNYTFTNGVATIASTTWNYYFADNEKSTTGGFSQQITCNDDQKRIRVINYKPLADIINGINNSTLTEYKNIKESYEQNYYTGTSTVQYLNALKEICDFDPNTYCNTSTNNYEACGKEIIRLLNNYNNAKDDLRLNTYTVTFVYNDGHTLKKKVKRFGTVTCPNDGSPEVVTTHNEDAHPNTHKVTRYYWGPADASIVKDMEYHELSAVSYIEHTWVQGETVAPTCDDDGYTVYECSVCHDTKHDDIVDANGHNYDLDNGSTATASNYTDGETYNSEKDYKHGITCTVDASHAKKEESCNIGASWVVEGDIEKSTCSTCGGYVTRPHIVGYDIVFKDKDGNVIATNPTIEGEMPSTPNLLNYAFVDEDGHHSFSWNKEVVKATEATEYQMVENELVPHAYADNYTEITAPTCYAEGLEADPCTVSRDCAYSVTRPISKTAHSYGEWQYDSIQRRQYHTCTVEECQKVEYDKCSFVITTNVAPTCREDGHIVYTCNDCGGSYEEFPTALGHDLSENWIPNNNSTHRKECSRCDYTDNEDCNLETTIIDPTCTSHGYRTSKCTVCGYETAPYYLYSDDGIDLDEFTSEKILNIRGGSVNSKNKNYPDDEKKYIEYLGNYGKHEVTYNLPFEVEKITFKAYSHTYNSGKTSYVSVKYNEGDNASDGVGYHYRDSKQADSLTMTNTSKLVLDFDLQQEQDFFVITEIKVWPKSYKATGHNYVTVYTPVNGDNNGYHEDVCQNDNSHKQNLVYDSTDWSAYDNILEVVEYNKSRTDMYTADSITAYTNIVNAITKNVDKSDVTKSQTFIDNIVKAIDGCKSYLKLATYSVTFIYEVDGVPTTVIDKEQIEYGTNVEMKVPSGLGSVYKWSYEIGDTTTKQAISNESITYIVAANTATIIAYVDSGTSAATGHSVKVYDKLGKLTDTKDVQDGKSINITEMNINTIAFYSITAYRVNGREVSISDAENYAVTENLEIQPVYSALGKEFLITPANENVMINGKSGAYKAAWDVKVTATGTDTSANTAWYVDDELVGYGETYTFRATKSCTVRYENAEEVNGIASLDFLDYGVYRDHAITVVGHYDVPEGATEVKTGVILKTVKNPTDTSRKLTFDEITVGNTNGKKYASTFTDTDQFKIVVTRTANTPILIGAVAFVEYKVNGESKVAYSAPQTIYGVN